MKRSIILFGLWFVLLPGTMAGAELNAGIVQGIWYSADSVFAHTPVRIYVAIRNSTGGDLTGTVTFYDNDTKIGSQSVSALSGRIIESWIDWKPEYGDHVVVAKLTRVKVSSTDNDTIDGDAVVTAAQDVLFVDYDTDKDGIGNERDTDDDGDNVSDQDEVAAGTDPLVYNEPIVAKADDTGADTRDDSVIAMSSSTPAGLEQYLTPSRADSIFTGITHWTQATKAKLDDYRESRAAERRGSSEPAVVVNENGFGEITRSTDTDQNKSTAEMPTGFFGDIIRVVGSIIGGVVTAILAITSWTLGYPMLVQLLLMLAVLFGIIYTAKRLGGRPIKD